MYTQCPDCSTAFRVTADVLKQAAGKVRCGGCGIAFNALSYLSETMPEQPVASDADAALPELKPDPPSNDDGLPTSISAAQSAALLKTLDELAGSDIRIEDTGVEWRVLDDDELGEAAGDESSPEPQDDELHIDEILDESPTPVDQFLTETPAVVDSPEIFESQETEFTRTSVDELRFDDNTPLPDDFDLDGEGFVESEVDSTASAEPEAAADDAVEPEPQPDFDLSEPDEWTDILGEFEELAEAVSPPLAAELEAAAALDDEPPDDAPEENIAESDAPVEDNGDPDDGAGQPLDMDSQFALQAEAMGIDLSGMHAAMEEEAKQDDTADDDDDLEALLSKSSDVELEGLLDEGFVEGLEPSPVEDFVDLEQLELIDDERSLAEELEDLEEEIEEAAEEISFEEPAEDPDEASEDKPEEEPAEDLDEASEDELEEEPEEDLDEAPEDELEQEPEDDLDEAPEDELEQEPEDDLDEAPEDELEQEPEDDLDEAPEDELDDELDDDSDEHVVPPLTEEEQTINMQIDQDLLALAIEDEDGFASTIVMPEASAEDFVEEKAKEEDNAEELLKSTGSGFETIIMEGEEFRSIEDLEKLETDAAAAASLAGAAAADRAAEETRKAGAGRYGIIGGIVVLLLLLGGQAVHQYREQLATIPAFNNAVGPLYRAIGQPLNPAWDITGWRFEVAKGTEEDDNKLTIYSRLGNKSETPLPYPLIAVSLTDRVEETIGSHILDPVEYLSNGLDPSKLVQPGNTFEAVISIQLPEVSTAGFRLRACYRTTDGLLRCKDDDFK